MKIAVLTDSGANLTLDNVKEHNNLFMVPLLITIDNQSHRDQVEISVSEIYKKWHDKKTNLVDEFVTTITISESAYEQEKIIKEERPECGAHLEKRGGCTQCSDPECYFEKCAI